MNSALDNRNSAVALSYADKTKAPVVVAKGYGLVAESIMREARENGLYVHASADLVKLLMQVNLDQQIPPQLYRAVAEVMAWIYGLEGQGESHAGHQLKT
ncbi:MULTISPECIES: EscU/YscU/HrcU family type III secretion system export apparatus switch protein [Variovorax]|jgi:flagellar biosynthesis protein|uniref:EscU/YscU/HrcU family type III secretion system export apparatus switch protein n=1 Tax=Variovorax TaxID=34072 RepID=UPI00086C020F|nr:MULTISPECIES: EscU/YscU/HrcU family type III secretion system export apparatus switch protein [Variovorax]MBN8757147.1 EscU/YscU/HrcU family type III secretion system export apparatus switch protein [Variovorax sp.]ODU17894.1 MAG: flagellar protein FhlB [Variovorax sp. SCN 67-85]ODV24429.1 MAG: flagellar protein FhlB [Variovorax sp. SCN 67-20]OJZ13632.1 MAG: flagellar protein FhlB [Variovorax sp. 67-131]UKI06287.1 EscU/YscU/HrcU family type III secretion system export apparatus switch prote